MKYILLFLFSITIINAQGQPYDSDKVNKRAVEAFERGLIHLRDGYFKEAIPLLNRAIEIEPLYADAILSLGGTYGELKDYQSAVEQYEKGRQIDTAYFKYYYLPYSINLAGLGRFEDALQAINQFLAIPELNERSRKSGEYRKRTYQFGVQYANKNPAGNYVFAPKNLGDSVNSPRSEYYPSITINDSLFVFTRRGNGYREDFFESAILGDKSFSPAKLIEGDINLDL